MVLIFFLGSLLLAVVCINVSDANLHHLFPPFPFIVCSIGFSRQDMNICSGAPRRFNLPKNYYYCRFGEVFSLSVLNITEFHFREIRPDFSIKNECNWGNIKKTAWTFYICSCFILIAFGILLQNAYSDIVESNCVNCRRQISEGKLEMSFTMRLVYFV